MLIVINKQNYYDTPTKSRVLTQSEKPLSIKESSAIQVMVKLNDLYVELKEVL